MPKNVDYYRVPRSLWRRLKRILPPEGTRTGPGRKPAENRRVMNGIWYGLWTGCQWKAVHRDWFGVCSTTSHQRFQQGQQSGVFERLMREFLECYGRRRGILWTWQASDSKSCPAALGGIDTGQSPVDRSKRGSKIHILVDGRGAPLAVYVTGANIHDQWLVAEGVISMVVPRPDPNEIEQHLCLDKGCDFADVHHFVEQERYVAPIKHRRRRHEPLLESCPVPGETQFQARRWVVE